MSISITTSTSMETPAEDQYSVAFGYLLLVYYVPFNITYEEFYNSVGSCFLNIICCAHLVGIIIN